MLELVHTITYSYETHSVIKEKFYINGKGCKMYQFYNVLSKHNNLIYSTEMDRTLIGTKYKESYRSN